MLAGVDLEEDEEVAAPDQTEEEIFAGRRAKIFGGPSDLSDSSEVDW